MPEQTYGVDDTLRVYDHRNHLIKTVPPAVRPTPQAYGHTHQPHNRLGTVTHQLSQNGIHHVEPDTK